MSIQYLLGVYTLQYTEYSMHYKVQPVMIEFVKTLSFLVTEIYFLIFLLAQCQSVQYHMQIIRYAQEEC